MCSRASSIVGALDFGLVLFNLQKVLDKFPYTLSFTNYAGEMLVHNIFTTNLMYPLLKILSFSPVTTKMSVRKRCLNSVLCIQELGPFGYTPS